MGIIKRKPGHALVWVPEVQNWYILTRQEATRVIHHPIIYKNYSDNEKTKILHERAKKTISEIRPLPTLGCNRTDLEGNAAGPRTVVRSSTERYNTP